MKIPDRTIITQAHLTYATNAYIELKRINVIRKTNNEKPFYATVLFPFLNITFDMDKCPTVWRDAWNDKTLRFKRPEGEVTWVQDLRGFILGDFSVRKT